MEKKGNAFLAEKRWVFYNRSGMLYKKRGNFMIQDIAPHRLHNEYRPQIPTEDSLFICARDRKILIKEEEGTVIFPSFRELDEKEQEREFVYLFTVDSTAFFLGEEELSFEKQGYSWENVQKLRTLRPRHLAFAGVTGIQLSRWYCTRKFCGACGNRLEMDKKERMLYCPVCGTMEYPKICPAVIVGIIDGNRILVSKYAGREYKKYALIAGFAEIGETIEETVKREVMEEVGLKVKNIRYYKSQPWGFTDTLLLGFFCDLDGDGTISLDEEELALAQWMEREDIPDEGDEVSLTKEMMAVFKEGIV